MVWGLGLIDGTFIKFAARSYNALRAVVLFIQPVCYI